MSKVCENCGAELLDEATSCHACGKEVATEPALNLVPQEQSQVHLEGGQSSSIVTTMFCAASSAWAF